MQADSRNTSTAIKKLHTDVWLVSIGALAIIIFLSVAFCLYDATSIEPFSTSNESSAPVQQKPKRGPQDLIAGGSLNFATSICGKFVCLSQSLTATAVPNNPTMWRFTNEGWQDISNLTPDPDRPQGAFASIHPLVLAGLVTIAATMALVLASSEQEVRRLFGLSIAKQNIDE